MSIARGATISRSPRDNIRAKSRSQAMTLLVPDFHKASVLVAGDVMLDKYWFGPTERISPEAPVPVVHVQASEERAGGGANVAVNLASLGVATRLVAVTGNDEAGDRLVELLDPLGVECRLTRLDGLATVTKLRVLSRNQQLIRLDFETDATRIPAAVLQPSFDAALDGAGAVVISDYGKGSLTPIEPLIRSCRGAGVPVLVDPKGRDFDRYRGATVITPNMAEFEAVVGRCADDSELAEKGHALRRRLNVAWLLVTRSSRGMTLLGPGEGVHHLVAEVREVFDVTGAGDTVIAVAAAGLAAGLSMESAAALSNLAAGLVVRKLGVASVSPSELRLALHQRGKGGRGVMGESELVEAVRQAQARGERVVMTNGCFDILHAGHIAYLEEAKALGDRLVVAVNDDDSVRRLKGDDRPINGIGERMTVLSGLAAVDWVVPFAEDTPERLICTVLPDVLVKGGDYRPEEIAGGQCVLENGGEVRVLSFREGCSTSDILDRVRGRAGKDR
jgi:D-beta-D-heptose 7-phosphate kinase/D-beta-D-heptose 1-phosphate adenosyltransferase